QPNSPAFKNPQPVDPNSVAFPRITLRTVARETESVRTISLIGKCRSKKARRICPILSTPIILTSPSRPHRPTGRDIDETSEGSRLDAKNPPQGVIIASEFTCQPNKEASGGGQHRLAKQEVVVTTHARQRGGSRCQGHQGH